MGKALDKNSFGGRSLVCSPVMAKAIQSFSLPAVLSTMNNLLKNKEFWADLVEEFKLRHPFNRRKYNEFKNLTDSDIFLKKVNDFITGNYTFSIPQKVKVNKESNDKKRIVYKFPLTDDIFLRAINKYLSEKYSYLVSSACHSFQKGKGAKSAFKSLLKDKNINKKAVLKLDIHNFYNSINIHDFFKNLPNEIKKDKLAYHYLEQILLNNSAFENGHKVTENKGLMAGTSIAPFLSNLYLKDIDEHFVNQGVTYARYSDDLIIFDYESVIGKHKNYIEEKIINKNLKLNFEKTFLKNPGESWDFLGFNYNNGQIDISDNSYNKLKRKIKRLSIRYYKLSGKDKFTKNEILSFFIAKINSKLYGKEKSLNDLCWSRWYFPLINTDLTLKKIDNYIQQRLRYSVSGRYSKINYKQTPYKKLQQSGYKPLTTMFYLFKHNYEKFNKIISNL